MCYRSSDSNYRSGANVNILAGYVLPWVFDKMPDHGSSLNYLGTKAHSKLHVPASFQLAARGFLSPPNDPINARALSLVPGYHSFSKWAIVEPGPRLRSILLTIS